MGRSTMVGLRALGLAGAIAIAGCAPTAASDRTTAPDRLVPNGEPPEVEAWEPYPHAIAFAPGSDALDDAAREALAVFVREVQPRVDLRRIRVEGSAHGAPTSDPRGLGSRRAVAVATALVAMDVPHAIIDVVVSAPHPDTGERRDEVVLTLLITQ